MASILRWQLEQAPVGIGKAREKASDFEMVLRHEANQRHDVIADIAGAGFLLHFSIEMVAALGRRFVNGPLKEAIKSLGNLEFDLIPAKDKRVALFAHM